jgi:serine/threonine-protein kinase RsbW
MGIGCEYSRLTIPNDPSYAEPAGRYVGEIAAKIGFGPGDGKRIERGVSDALLKLFDYSFEPGERTTCDIVCERVPEGLRVVIRDKGLPLDPVGSRRSLAGGTHDGVRDSAIAPLDLGDCWDEVRFNNLGPQGKETVLIKYLSELSLTDFYRACEIWPFEPEVEPGPSKPEKIEFEVRLMKPEEAVEVAKCIYQAYGYTYSYEHVYFPEKVVEMNKTGQMTSAVAVARTGEIMGHCALGFNPESPRIALLGQGAVKPEFRSYGSFRAMSEFLLEKARARGLLGVFGEAVTVHTMSQQAAHRLGMTDTAPCLGRIPRSVRLRGSGETAQRMTVLTNFIYLERPSRVLIHPPEQHREMITVLFERLGIVPITDSTPGATEPESDSVLRVGAWGVQGYGEIDVERFGERSVDDVESAREHLRRQGIEVIHLRLDLADPWTSLLTEQLERLGFFFCGILPGAMKSGDALILQYLDDVPIDYDRIAVYSSEGRELLEYVKEHDPNRSK